MSRRRISQAASEESQIRAPERRLLAAMLQRAILDYGSTHSEEAVEAEKWLFDSVGKPMTHFSAAWVCEQLGLQLEAVLSAIRKTKVEVDYAVISI